MAWETVPYHMGEPRLVGIHHVQLAMPPGREGEAVAFYEGLLGLERVRKPEHLTTRGGCWFRGSGVEVHLGVEEGFRPARKAHPAFLTSGLAGLRGRLEASGVPVSSDAELKGFERFYVADPFGNRIELVEAR